MLNWDDLQLFLAVAQHGTLSAAARALKVTQPTVGRRIATFEAELGAQLFERASKGWTLTEVGRAVQRHAARMQEHALSAEHLASGRDRGVAGHVKVTASEWLIRSVLGPALGPFLEHHPALEIELIADPRHLNLARREADLALRLSKFAQQDVIAREVATVEFGLYASDTYLARRGLPDFARGCEGHVLIGLSEGMGKDLIDHGWLAALAARARLAVRTNGREPMATMAAAGVGIAVLPRVLGDATQGLRSLVTPQAAPRRTLWVGVHRAARATPRVRATLAFIARSFEQLQSVLAPSGHTTQQR